MQNHSALCPCTRREFLSQGVRGLGLIAFAQYAPAFLTQAISAQAPAAEKDRPILVLIQLAGGNDGLNTLIPHGDDRYYRLRPTLGIPARDVLKIDGYHGLHPSLGPLDALRAEGKLGIVQNVGYPNPNRSHFRSTEIWETASDADEASSTGWVGRYLDNACAGTPSDGPTAIHFTEQMPQAYTSDHPLSIFGSRPRGAARAQEPNRDLLKDLAATTSDHAPAAYLSHTLMDALVAEERLERIFRRYRADADYPGHALGQSLKRVASLIASGLSTRVYYTSLGGFDTHYGQATTHARLLGQLAGAMAAFQKDLEAKGLSDQVLTMTFSEFGRRPGENVSKGTDHGTAAPLFVMGSRIQQPLSGEAPDLAVDTNQDLTFSTDFRQVYATVLSKWLQCPQTDRILGGNFAPLAFI